MFKVPSAVWGITLVDCTATGVTKGDSKERNQQRNWETIIQTFGILTQPILLEFPQIDTFTDNDKFQNSIMYRQLGHKHRFNFEMLKPELNFWIFAIGSEHNGVFGENLDRLNNAFDMIPIVPNLDSSIDLKPSVFQTKDPELINIQFFDAVTEI
jgi:hypothetical protein